MKCQRTDCFAFSPVLENNCSALEDTRGCNFYKTVEQIRREEEVLRAGNHPTYRPSVTRNDQRILKVLLRRDGKRTDNLDKT